ncbi:MAG: hypothetical protein HY923_00530 [Elusimicrobia bacterium]|nr:hypothetical protein [Elusimicrobiota bacterium]
MALFAALALFLAAPALAYDAAPAAPAPQEFVDPGTLKARADALRDAVADPSVSDISVKTRSAGFFDKLPEQTLVVPVRVRLMDREPVAGKLGTVEGMQAEADRRIEKWKREHVEPPPPELDGAVDEARALKNSKRLDYDDKDELKENQLGIYKYVVNSVEGGYVKLNERLKILTAVVGECFTYATVAHEARHSRDRALGKLSPEKEIAGEISAYRTQYQWLKLMDPTGERMLTLHGSLRVQRDRATDPKLKNLLNQGVVYLEHLSDVVETNGKEEELKKLVERLGYSDHHDHEHGRGANSPTGA